MDIEKTMQFILDMQAKFFAGMEEMRQKEKESRQREDESRDEQGRIKISSEKAMLDLIDRLTAAQASTTERLNALFAAQAITDERLKSLIRRPPSA